MHKATRPVDNTNRLRQMRKPMAGIVPNRTLAVLARCLALAIMLCVMARPASAHPAPFSYLDVSLNEAGIEGTLTVHIIDVAYELGLETPEQASDLELLRQRLPQFGALMGSRLNIASDVPLVPQWQSIEIVEANDAVRLSFVLPDATPGSFDIAPQLFPYDPQHQTFVNVYEGNELTQQWIFAATSAPRTYYSGSSQGVLAVMETFVPSGAHHILIGPDHLLFLFALLLLGGSVGTLVRIVTAFTIGHSITLSLAALDIVTLSGSIVEPAIAVTIIVVGADNLLRGQGRDLRSWMALAFGLIHGFGFASVLQEFGLPQSALGWSLFSFNVGVELGQLVAVVPLAFALAFLRKKSPEWNDRVVIAGSIFVIGAGTWWFIQRVFL